MQINCTYDSLENPKSLKPSPKNPNHHSPDQIDRLCKILQYQGYRAPIVVSKQTGFVVVGHARLQAAMKMDLTEVPVNYQDFENEDQEYAHMVADNSIGEWAELDLSQINLDIGDLGPDFDIENLGLKDFTIEPADKYEESKIKEKEISELQTEHECPSCGYKW